MEDGIENGRQAFGIGVLERQHGDLVPRVLNIEFCNNLEQASDIGHGIGDDQHARRGMGQQYRGLEDQRLEDLLHLRRRRLAQRHQLGDHPVLRIGRIAGPQRVDILGAGLDGRDDLDHRPGTDRGKTVDLKHRFKHLISR